MKADWEGSSQELFEFQSENPFDRVTKPLEDHSFFDEQPMAFGSHQLSVRVAIRQVSIAIMFITARSNSLQSCSSSESVRDAKEKRSRSDDH